MRKLGKYEVLGELGHGAMGVVYRARDPIINRLVALKTITTGLADDPNLLQRFYREAQSAGGLQHPNIVTIYDMGDEQNVPYIAMELIEGESLEQMISRRMSVPLILKLTYALQACRAFDYAHKRGIVHRDIKPGNVMVNKEGVVKVVDFGIARVLDTSQTQTGMLIGTFAYMSPEQYQGQHADERSDIWSFGVLLYELLCYQRPFTGENPMSLMNSICSQEPRTLTERVPDCPPAMEAILAKILRKSPQDRFQSMEDLLLELEPVYKDLQSRSIAERIEQSRELIEKSEFAQARELLREALKVDSGNPQARALLEKVNTELKRLLIRPKAQQHVDKGRALLEEGRIQEARAEIENALQLDSTFEQAQELEKRVQREVDRAQMIAEWLQASGQRLAEGMPDEAEILLGKVLEMEPANRQAKDLQRQVLAEKAERQRRLRLLEKMQEARVLWTQLNYEGCIEILSNLQKEFPREEEVQRLLDTVSEDQAEQHRQKTLERARNLLAVGNYEESGTLLLDLQKQFPSDEEIPKLLEEIRLDEAKQRRSQGLAEARSYLASRQFDESIVILTALEGEFRGDAEISHLLEVAREDQAEQQRQQGIAEARDLLAARRYDECNALLTRLQKEFPNDSQVLELQRAAREGEAQQQKQQGIAQARDLRAARRYDECNVLLVKLEKQFPRDSELLELQKTVREDQAQQQKQQAIAEARNLLSSRRYDECNALLTKLRKQFPGDSEISQLQKTLAENQSEQRKIEGLAKARNLLASRSYGESIALLAGMGKEFADDEDVRQLLKTAREDQAEQHRQAGMAEARNLLGARRYDDCDALLAKLRKQFPDDSEIPRIQEAAREERAGQEKLGSLAKARNLLAKGNYDECIALLSELGERFPNNEDVSELLATARNRLAEQRKLKSLTEARNLLAGQRYAESVSLLTELKKEFPDDREIPRLLANASKEQAEQQKQQKLAEGRALLAAQRFSEALELLDNLAGSHPKDTAVQKLRALVERERDKQSRSESLQRSLEALKKLVSEKKYSELLTHAEPLRAEFPANGDLLRLIDFAKSQQAQIDSELRLRTALDQVKTHIRASQFAEAIRAADAGLTAFPEHAELVYLREQAEAQEKKKRARGMIEQRIREIKFKINREDLSEAIDLAKQTIAITGPDAELTQLLNSAVVEFQAREKKRRQEQKLQEIRTMMESGNIDGASETLHDALETEALNAFDSRVNRVSQEIDAAKNKPTVVSPPAAPSVPPNFSKEYAFLQGRPVDDEPSPMENVGPSETAMPRASAAQPTISSQPVVPMPPPRFESAPRPAETPAPILPRESANVPAVPVIPKRSTVPERVQDRATETATRPVPAVPAPNFKKAAMLAALSIGLLLGVLVTVHLVSSPKTEAPSVSIGRPKGAPSGPTSETNPATAAAVPPKPVVNQVEAQPPAAGSEKPPASEPLATLRQREAVLWQRATTEVDKAEFDAAKSDLRKIIALGDGGVRKPEAQRYLNDLIPRRQKEEEAFQQAEQDSQGRDPQGLQRAVGLLAQVVSMNGPRKTEAEGLLTNVKAKRDSILAALEASCRVKIQQGDFEAARKIAEQFGQAGGDPAVLSKEIDQAQLIQAQTAQFQQAVQAYNVAVGNRDKASIEKSRGLFETIVRENGPYTAQARQYLNKLDALNPPPPPPPPPPLPPPPEDLIRDVVQRFIHAFEQRNPEGVRQVWPTIQPRAYAGYKNSFDEASAIQMRVVDEIVTISQDRAMATVHAQLAQQYTPKGQKTMNRTSPWTFSLAKTNGTWVITDIK